MNYSDFGVTCAEELEQDEWSLTRPTFETPKGGVLTVVGWKGKRGSLKYYVTTCNICKNDSELFGQACFSILKNRLVKGVIPCGCSVHPRWSEEQYKIRVEREVKIRGYAFKGWGGVFEGAKTRCSLTCPEHGVWNTTSIHRFFRGDGCPRCADKIRIPHLRVPHLCRLDLKPNLREDSFHIKKFMSFGSFLPGTEFWRSENKDKNGQGYWKYTCPKCSHDEYVKAGLCNGVFEGHYSSIGRGCLACRCSSLYKWTQEQKEFQIKLEMSERSEAGISHLQFVGWDREKGYVNSKSRFIFWCEEHGEQITSANIFLSRSCGCPQCAGNNQGQAYINIVEDAATPVAVKFGIANDAKKRLRQQNRTNVFRSRQIFVWEFSSVTHCKAAERECKQTLKTGVISSREMKDGWTETVSVLDLEKVIAIYEKHGGKRIK